MATAAQCACLVDFNDQCGSFADLHAVIVKAKALALHDSERPRREVTAPKPKRQTAAENKQQLLAQIERERKAAGHRPTSFVRDRQQSRSR